MNTIELEHWKPSIADPRRMEYVGQPTAQEVFEELKYRLGSTGYLPDEYFLIDSEWENGQEIPKDADIFCTTDYGTSEGVYLDVYLKWYDKEQNKSITKTFITGKTLGENGNDLDRMPYTRQSIWSASNLSAMNTSPKMGRMSWSNRTAGCRWADPIFPSTSPPGYGILRTINPPKTGGARRGI